jgi:hypothetical protein
VREPRNSQSTERGANTRNQTDSAAQTSAAQTNQPKTGKQSKTNLDAPSDVHEAVAVDAAHVA